MKCLTACAMSRSNTTKETGDMAPIPVNAYKSSHWDQPNILAHIRFNERTDADGKRVLFLEEIQGDWQREPQTNRRHCQSG